MAAHLPEDPYLWLEDILGEEALDWVRARNAPTAAQFSGEDFERMRTQALEVLDTDARIPYVRRRGDYLYNFWRDAANPRGLWRRTTLDSYRSDNPAWDVLIDVDELARLSGRHQERERNGYGLRRARLPGLRRRRQLRAAFRLRHGDVRQQRVRHARVQRPVPERR